MALTQAEWFTKLQTFVPSWFFTESGANEALFQGLAKVLADAHTEMEATLGQTFLEDATGSYLDLHGSERNVTRISGETDASYRERIINIQHSTSVETLLAQVTAVLNNGIPLVVENWKYGFLDDEFYCDDDDSILLSRAKSHRWFTVITPVQTAGVAATIQANIISVLEENKAFGVSYDVFYRT